MTTRVEFADVLERFASDVIELPGVSRTRPHAFAENKDALAKAMLKMASAYRTGTAAALAPPAPRRAIEPGARQIGGRRVLVEIRRPA